MWKRISWDIVCLILVFLAPWWVTLAAGIIGAIAFNWFIELVILGALYDALFGGLRIVWYGHIIHTAIFALGLLVVEGAKTALNL